MKITKVIKNEGRAYQTTVAPNEIRISGLYPTKEQLKLETGQHILGLKNLLLVYSRGFAKVDALSPIEDIKTMGVEYAKKVGSHVVIHSIKFLQVEQVLRNLVAVGKADLNERKIVLAMDLLASAVKNIQPGYDTRTSN